MKNLRDWFLSVKIIAVVSLFFSIAGEANAQTSLPPTGFVTQYAGVTLYGQCVPEARELGVKILNRTLPYLGTNGVAADLWVVPTPGFAKRPRIQNGLVAIPPKNAFIVWSKSLGGTGHVAMVVGTVDGPKRIVRVVDTNWGLDQRGQIHDVNLNDSKILGYLVWQ